MDDRVKRDSLEVPTWRKTCLPHCEACCFHNSLCLNLIHFRSVDSEDWSPNSWSPIYIPKRTFKTWDSEKRGFDLTLSSWTWNNWALKIFHKHNTYSEDARQTEPVLKPPFSITSFLLPKSNPRLWNYNLKPYFFPVSFFRNGSGACRLSVAMLLVHHCW